MLAQLEMEVQRVKLEWLDQLDLKDPVAVPESPASVEIPDSRVLKEPQDFRVYLDLEVFQGSQVHKGFPEPQDQRVNQDGMEPPVDRGSQAERDQREQQGQQAAQDQPDLRELQVEPDSEAQPDRQVPQEQPALPEQSAYLDPLVPVVGWVQPGLLVGLDSMELLDRVDQPEPRATLDRAVTLDGLEVRVQQETQVIWQIHFSSIF